MGLFTLSEDEGPGPRKPRAKNWGFSPGRAPPLLPPENRHAHASLGHSLNRRRRHRIFVPPGIARRPTHPRLAFGFAFLLPPHIQPPNDALIRNSIERVRDPAQLIRDHVRRRRTADDDVALPAHPHHKRQQQHARHESNSNADPRVPRQMQIHRKRLKRMQDEPPGRGAARERLGPNRPPALVAV